MDLKAMLEENRAILSALPSRPGPDAVEKAQRAVAEIEKKLVSTLEGIMQTPAPSGDALEDFKLLQVKKRYIANTEAEAEKRKYLPVVQLEERYRHHEEVIRRAELALVAANSQEEASRLTKQEAARKLLEEIQEVISTGATEVDWSNRDVDYLPESFGKMTSVTSLNLSRNFLEGLPDAIAGLSSLRVLHISGNRLARLPDSIGALTQLRVLDASKNQLVEVPDTICNCSLLEELNLSFNRLARLPEELAASLPALRKLVVSLNKLKYLPHSFGKLQRLTHLDLHFNQLSEVTPAIGHLQQLQYLDISDNFADLIALPGTIGNLASLTELKLSNNQIRELPVEFGKLAQLAKLELDGNPWFDPPLPLVEKKDRALLLAYLEQRYKDSLSPSPHAPGGGQAWSQWLSDFFGGNFAFTAWLNGVMSGLHVPQLTGPQQGGARGAGSQGTEMDALKASLSLSLGDEDLEGGSTPSRQTSLPLSTTESRQTF